MAKQKTSVCVHTLEGARHFPVIHTCLAALHKQGHAMPDAIAAHLPEYPSSPQHAHLDGNQHAHRRYVVGDVRCYAPVIKFTRYCPDLSGAVLPASSAT